jgi:UDP-glucuronate 4-epimerase
VVVLDNFNDYYDPRIKKANIQPYLADPQFHLVLGDLLNESLLMQLFTRHAEGLRRGGIVHLAARAGVRPSLEQPEAYLETNVKGTMTLAELARRHEISKFVFASSSSVYGDSPDRVPFSEDQPVNRPISPYAATKVMGENLLHTYSHLYGLQVVALRFFTVYGAGQRPDLAIHKFTRLIEAGKPIPVFGDGSTRRDYTFIDDILQGILGAIRYDKAPFDVFNLGESQTTSLSELIEHIERALGKQAIIDRKPLQPGDVSITYADISKAQQLLGYRPTTKIADGIPRFVAWFREMQASLLQPAG